MKSGYDQFFQKARKVASEQPGNPNLPKRSLTARLEGDISTQDLEAQIRRRMKMTPRKVKKKNKIPWKILGVSFVGFLFAIWGFNNYEQVENVIRSVEINMTGEAFAEDTKAAASANKTEEKNPKAAEGESAKTATANEEAPAEVAAATDTDPLLKLNDRKKELDAREEELNRMESELQVQKVELENRLKELEEMRTKISSMLEDRVKADDQKVDTLVQMYTNMKAPQAAKVFETIDEDLAIQILGRMKKKNAADIMNLLKPEKAQALSEMIAGYKRRTPASK